MDAQNSQENHETIEKTIPQEVSNNESLSEENSQQIQQELNTDNQTEQVSNSGILLNNQDIIHDNTINSIENDSMHNKDEIHSETSSPPKEQSESTNQQEFLESLESLESINTKENFESSSNNIDNLSTSTLAHDTKLDGLPLEQNNSPTKLDKVGNKSSNDIILSSISIVNIELKQIIDSISKQNQNLGENLNHLDIQISEWKNNKEQLNLKIKELEDQKEQNKSFGEKVDQWKASVKEISRKDLAKITKLQKDLAQQIQDNKIQWEQRHAPKNDHYDILECTLEKEGSNSKWYFIEYHDKSLGKQWIESQSISQEKKSTYSNIPLPIQDRLKISFEEDLNRLQKEIEDLKKKNEESENALQQYKARALQALKKKSDSINELKVEYEKQIANYEIQLNELTQKFNESQETIENQKTKLSNLSKLEEINIEIQNELKQKTASQTELQLAFNQQSESLKDIEKTKDLVIFELETEINNLKNQLSIEEKKIDQEKNDNDQLKKDIEEIREEVDSWKQKYQQMENEKDSRINLLKKSYTELKSKFNVLSEQNQHYSKYLEDSELKNVNGGISQFNGSSFNSIQDNGSDSKISNNEDEREANLLKNIVNKESKNPFLLLKIPEDSPFAKQISEISKKYMERENELQDKIQHIEILKESLASKTNEVHQLHLSEKELREHISQIQESHKKGSPNIDYLRNVFQKYIHTDDESIRSHSLRALGQLLSLSKEEISKLESKHSKTRLWF